MIKMISTTQNLKFFIISLCISIVAKFLCGASYKMGHEVVGLEDYIKWANRHYLSGPLAYQMMMLRKWQANVFLDYFNI